MTRTTAYYLCVSIALLTLIALVRPTMPPRPPAEEPEQVGAVPADPSLDLLGQRSVAQHRLVAEVIAGRRLVFAAAALFRELNRLAPEPDVSRLIRGDPLPVPFPAATEDEMYCFIVARWAYVALRGESPDRADEVVARLAAEVRAEAAARGAVRLPDPATLEPVERLLADAQTWRVKHPHAEK